MEGLAEVGAEGLLMAPERIWLSGPLETSTSVRTPSCWGVIEVETAGEELQSRWQSDLVVVERLVEGLLHEMASTRGVGSLGYYKLS